MTLSIPGIDGGLEIYGKIVGAVAGELYHQT